jgi:HlyD family secretion protein
LRGAKFWLIAGGVVLTVAVVVAGAVRGFAKAAVEVKTAVAEERMFEDKVLATGRVEATNRIDVVAPFAARLLSLKVREGDRVVAGQVLGEMDASDVEDRVKEAEAALAVAEAELAQALKPARTEEIAQAEAALKAAEAQAGVSREAVERTRYLFEQEAASQAELDTAEAAYVRAQADVAAASAHLTALKEPDPGRLTILEARVEQARVAVTSARRALAKKSLTAPGDGVVITTAAREGNFLQQSALILTVGDPGQFEVVANLSEQDIGGVTAGQDVEITWAGRPDKTWTGKVDRVSPGAAKSTDRETENAVRVFVKLHEEDLIPGATVDVVIYRVKPVKTILVPNEAVVVEGKRKSVFVVDKKTARKHPVQTGRGNELYTEIKTGIKPGATVVLNPKDLKDGQPVRLAGGQKQ